MAKAFISMSQLVKITKHSSSINGSNTSSHESNISDSGQLQCWFPVAEDSGNLQNLEARQNGAVFLKSQLAASLFPFPFTFLSLAMMKQRIERRRSQDATAVAPFPWPLTHS